MVQTPKQGYMAVTQWSKLFIQGYVTVTQWSNPLYMYMAMWQ